jgi:hypothetical protein
MLVQTILAAGALLPLGVFRTLLLITQVHLMLEVARGTFLAQSAHPVLADQSVERRLVVVLLGTVVPQRTMALAVRFADWDVRTETDAIFSLQERVELELVFGRVCPGLEDSLAALVNEGVFGFGRGEHVGCHFWCRVSRGSTTPAWI